MDNQYREQRIKQIVSQLEGRETDDLLKIWQENDRQEWSNEAFDAIEEILGQRLGHLPSQGIFDAAPGEAVVSARQRLGSLPRQGLSNPSPDDEEEADTYHNFEQLIKISSYARTLSWVCLGGAGTLLVVLFLSEMQGFGGIPLGALMLFLFSCFFVLLPGAFAFVVLQALAEGIYLFMDIESNTRPTPGVGTDSNSQ
jgi:hypothetical protein